MPRKRRTTTTRKRKVSSYARCIGKELKGRKFRSQVAVRRAFKDATKLCRVRLTRR